MTGLRYTVSVEGRSYVVTLIERRGERLSFEIGGHVIEAEIQPEKVLFVGSRSSTSTGSVPIVASSVASRRGTHAVPHGTIVAPMPGVVSSLPVQAGQSVAAGETVIVLEAMKMENPIQAPCAGVVGEVCVQVGRDVSLGDVLIRLKTEEVG